MTGTVWISWNDSLRSRNLSQDFGIPLYVKVFEHSVVSRHIFSSMWTIYILTKHRPTCIFIQYSFLLLLFIAIYKLITPYHVCVIADCHTKALRRSVDGILGRIFKRIKRKSFQYADLIILSNDGMVSDALEYTDRHFILPDRIPTINDYPVENNRENYCVFVSSYADDEPLEEVIKAADILKGKIKIYCTGRIPKHLNHLNEHTYSNIYFTNYLTQQEYESLISNATCVLALTEEEDCLQCAGYEALSLGLPLVVSDTAALKSYFGNTVIYVQNIASDIAFGIEKSMSNKTTLKNDMKKLEKLRRSQYKEAISDLLNKVSSLSV
jgi:glycosyltransferase involved in cell wall biosynthesis